MNTKGWHCGITQEMYVYFFKGAAKQFSKVVVPCYMHIAGGEFQVLLILSTLGVRSTLCSHPLVHAQ